MVAGGGRMIEFIANFPVLIIVISLFGALLTPLIGWFRKDFCNPWVSLVTLVQFLIALTLLHSIMNGGTIHYYLGNWEPPWGIEYVVDMFNAYVLCIISFIFFLVSIYSRKSVQHEMPGRVVPFYTLYLLLTMGLLGITITGDIFNLYVFLEVSSLSAYALISVGDFKNALMASFNYVIMGTISACFILLGIGYIYMVTGSLNMHDLSLLLPALYTSKVILVAFAFFMVGFSIKVALFPLHTWLPDAYTTAPSAVSALVAATFTKVGAYAMIRIMFTVFKPQFVIDFTATTNILAWVAAVAIIVGSVLAIAQFDIKRMLAYSSVSQIGYIVLGVGLANHLGMMGSVLHILNHALMKGGLFMVAGAIFYTSGIRNIYQFRGMGKKMPWTMGAFLILALSMIGIPPTVGFMSKWYLILGAIDGDMWVFVVVILLSSLLNVVYFWRVFENVYFGHVPEDIVKTEVPLSMRIPIIIAAILCIVLGLFAYLPLDNVIEPAVNLLLGR
jgi:multicomponent Na+:H+ antiporter subunit D